MKYDVVIGEEFPLPVKTGIYDARKQLPLLVLILSFSVNLKTGSWLPEITRVAIRRKMYNKASFTISSSYR